MLRLPATTSAQDYIPLQGGLDILTPVLQLKPGVVREARNFECSITGGYTRIKGYERFDGRPNPSDATYIGMTVNVTGAISVGNTITGVTSAATGVVIYRSGSLVVFTKGTGTFQLGETLNVAASPQGTITDLAGAESDLDFPVRMQGLAADLYRTDILAVPGSGPVRGVIYFGGLVYAFRDNAGGTALDVYKSSAAGWVAVPMSRTVSFTLGTSEYVDGETLTQGGVSAPIRRVCLESGSWGAGTAAGRLILGTVTGGAFAAGAATGGGACTLSGADTVIALSPGGSIEFDIGAVGAERRIYAVDGINKAFEFDGTTLAPIVTGNSPDVPQRVMVHVGHLFLSFGNSLQQSGIGTPFTWTADAGAGERLVDGDVTVLKRMPGNQTTGAAAVFHESGMQVLYGTSETDFQLATFEDTSGAKPRTAQLLGQMFVLDDRGVQATATTQAYGNFAASSITLGIRTFVQTRRNTASCSLLNREKSQYRLFFRDGTGLYITVANGQPIGSMPVEFPLVVRCCCQGETPDGTEVSYFGDEDGKVYRLDAGTSFDGAAIDYDFTLTYAYQRGPRTIKRYRKITAEVVGDSYCEFGIAGDFAYGLTEREQLPTPTSSAILLSPTYWDRLVWDYFIWDGRSLSPVEIDFQGHGENVAIRVAGSSALYDSFTINSFILTYSARRQMR